MQVYRKIWHFSFIWAPVAYYCWLTNLDGVVLSAAFLLFFLVLDAIRLNWSRGNEIAYRHFSWLLREQERKGFNTSIYFALSCLICSLFFEKTVTVLCIALLCVGDPIAALVGSRFGTVRILNKSLQGSLACFVACFLVAELLFEPTIAFWAALTATFFELISSRLNDNLSIPIFTGLMVTLLLGSPQLTSPMQYLLLFFRVYLIFVIVTSMVGIGVKHYILHYVSRHYAGSFQRREGFHPSVSVVKPICGLVGGEYASFATFCEQSYPGTFEIVFVVQDPLDPVVRVVDRLKLAYPRRSIRLVIGGKNPRVTDKMNNLIHGARHATGDILVFSDDMARVGPDYLRNVVAPLADARIGIVTAVAAYGGARTVPAALNAHLVNLLGQSLYYALPFFDRLETANGCTLALRRQVYDEVGGYTAVSDQISDAHALAQAVHGAGYRIHLLERMVRVHEEGLSLVAWLKKTHRMVVAYKAYAGSLYPLFLFQLGFVHALVYSAIFPASPTGPVLAVLSLLLEIASHLRMNYLYVKDRNTYYYIWLLPVLLAIAPVLWASAYVSRVVDWRGQRYFVDQAGVATRLKDPEEPVRLA